MFDNTVSDSVVYLAKYLVKDEVTEYDRTIMKGVMCSLKEHGVIDTAQHIILDAYISGKGTEAEKSRPVETSLVMSEVIKEVIDYAGSYAVRSNY